MQWSFVEITLHIVPTTEQTALVNWHNSTASWRSWLVCIETMDIVVCIRNSYLQTTIVIIAGKNKKGGKSKSAQGKVNSKTDHDGELDEGKEVSHKVRRRCDLTQQMM